jgi:hypothetical protein
MRSHSFRVPALAVVLIAGTLGSGLLQARRESLSTTNDAGPRTIILTDAVDALPVPPGKVEAPVLSPRGDRMALVVDEYENELLHLKVGSVWISERHGDAWQNPRLFRKGNVQALGGLETFFHPSFGEDGVTVIYNHVHVDTTVFVPSVASLHSWIETDGSETRWEAERMGLHEEIIEHPRVSPDGRWLTFYVHRKPATRGIWLRDLRSGKLQRVSDQDDKHPVWTPDGTKILFHHQTGGDAVDRVPLGTPERSELGFLELDFSDPDRVTAKRVLLDSPSRGFRFQKHPMMMPGSDLVFFHGRERPGGAHLLMARRLRPGSPVYRLEVFHEGHEIVKAKHPSTTYVAPVVVFVGAVKGGRAGVFQLRRAALEHLEREVKG